MIQCPNCHATLPDWAKTCQFCQSNTESVIRPTAPGSARNVHAFEAPKWVWGAYYGLAGYYILHGLYTVISSVMTLVAVKKADSTDQVSSLKGMPTMHDPMGMVSLFTYVAILIGVVSIVLGGGLMVRNNSARGVVNFFCGLNIIFGVFKLLGATLGALFSGLLGVFLMLLVVIDICVNGFMIYLIGETDKYSY